MDGSLRGKLRWALAFALVVGAGAAAATAGFYVAHAGQPERAEARAYAVELRPEGPGAYHLDLPVPVDERGDAQPLAAPAVEGRAQVSLVRTGYGLALHVEGRGPATLRWDAPVPLRLSLEDAQFTFRQFRFWAYASEDSAPVHINVTLAQRQHEHGWDLDVQRGKQVVVDGALQPGAWTRVSATQVFDVRAQTGYVGDFRRVALASADSALGVMYVPLGVLLATRRDG